MSSAPLLSRRMFLAGAAAGAASLTLMGKAGAATTTTGLTRWISATPAGKKDGTRLADAAPLSALPALVAAVGPGGNVLLDASKPYVVNLKNPIALRTGGTTGGRITVRGAKPDGSPALAVLTSNRPDPWTGTGAEGTSWIELAAGSGHLVFQSLQLNNMRRPFWVTANVPDLMLSGIRAHNIDRLLEVSDVVGSGARVPGAVPDLVVHDVVVTGFTGPLLKLRGADRALIEMLDADALCYPSDYPKGVALVGYDAASASGGVVVQSCSFRGLHGATGGYLQGDGITAEPFDHHLTIRDTTVTDSWDGGIDVKSSATICERVTVVAAKRSFRFHQPATPDALQLVDCVSIDPRLPVGMGSKGRPAHVQATGSITVTRGSFADTTKDVLLAEAEAGGSVRFDSTSSLYHAGPLQVAVSAGGVVSGADTVVRLAAHP
jgi:hypothetical protein